MDLITPLCVFNMSVQVYGQEHGALPVGVDDLAESQLTAHLQIALVLGQVTRGALRRVNFAVFI